MPSFVMTTPVDRKEVSMRRKLLMLLLLIIVLGVGARVAWRFTIDEPTDSLLVELTWGGGRPFIERMDSAGDSVPSTELPAE